jgi:hypothetical protein
MSPTIPAVERLDAVSNRSGRPKVYPVEVVTDRAAWHRQPGERVDQFEAFVTYRDLGAERALSRVVEITGRPISTVMKWSSRWGWPARVKCWNADTDAEHRDKMAERLRVTLDRQYAQGEQLEAAAVELLMQQVASGGVYPKDAVALVLGLRKDQRQAAGWIEQRGPVGPAVTVNVDASTHTTISRAELDMWSDRVMSAMVAAYGPDARAVMAAALEADAPTVIAGELA